MDHPLVVHVLKPKYHARQHKLGLFFIKTSAFADMIAQVSTCEQITYKKQILSILKCVVYVY